MMLKYSVTREGNHESWYKKLYEAGLKCSASGFVALTFHNRYSCMNLKNLIFFIYFIKFILNLTKQ